MSMVKTFKNFIMKVGAKEISQTMFHSAGYISNDMKEISSLLQESTGDVQLNSSAVEQFTGMVSEISETSGKAHLNTTNTRKKIELLEEDVHKLGTAGEDVSKVTKTVAEISHQVNLLALNATIEAARAGEAGKVLGRGGAHEIKELAK